MYDDGRSIEGETSTAPAFRPEHLYYNQLRPTARLARDALHSHTYLSTRQGAEKHHEIKTTTTRTRKGHVPRINQPLAEMNSQGLRARTLVQTRHHTNGCRQGSDRKSARTERVNTDQARSKTDIEKQYRQIQTRTEMSKADTEGHKHHEGSTRHTQGDREQGSEDYRKREAQLIDAGK